MKWCLVGLFLALALCVGCSRATPSMTAPRTTATPIPYICVDASARALVWEDRNANGIREDDEPPLPNVCVVGDVGVTGREDWIPEWCGQGAATAQPEALTNAQGEWYSAGFVAGACGPPDYAETSLRRECIMVNIVVIPGPSHRVTTPGRVAGCQAQFGLIRVEVPARGPTTGTTPTQTPKP